MRFIHIKSPTTPFSVFVPCMPLGCTRVCVSCMRVCKCALCVCMCAHLAQGNTRLSGGAVDGFIDSVYECACGRDVVCDCVS